MYLVIGTGRSGTSITARLLHTRLNVFMGHDFVPANKHNEQGYYEDVEFYNANDAFLFGKIIHNEWANRVMRLIEERRSPWGFKYSRIANLLGLYLGLLDTVRIIHWISASG
jgi:hypothetical protein